MFSGYYFWVSPSLSLQDIFQTPLDLLGAEQTGFLAVTQEVRHTCRPFDIPGSKIVKIYPRRKQSFQRSRSVDLCSLFDAVCITFISHYVPYEL